MFHTNNVRKYPAEWQNGTMRRFTPLVPYRRGGDIIVAFEYVGSMHTPHRRNILLLLDRLARIESHVPSLGFALRSM